MSQGYTTIDKIVRSACMEEGDYGLHQYELFLEWALECFQDFRIDSIPEIKTVVETASSISTVPFPVDYVGWLKIGVKQGDRVSTMTTNNSLSNHFDLDSSGSSTANGSYSPNYSSATGLDGYYFRNTSFGNSNYGSIFGYGNGTQGDGSFKVDKANRRFILNSDYNGCDILIEYLTTGLNASGETLVEETLRKAVKFYILHRKTQRGKSYGMGEKQSARHDWYEAKKMALRRNFTVDAKKLIAIVRGAYKLTPTT